MFDVQRSTACLFDVQRSTTCHRTLFLSLVRPESIHILGLKSDGKASGFEIRSAYQVGDLRSLLT